ncbi:MAG: alpha-galactosidase [Agathobacter sp.]|nr:alpha-galactosidase [Agathobacter sp.]
MIRQLGKTFVLDTDNTTYCFRIIETGHLEHLYYGERLYIESESDIDVLVEKHSFAPGNTNVYDNEHANFSLEDMRLELSTYGKGDIREPFVIIKHADGSITSDFLYLSCEIKEGKTSLQTLPSTYEDDGRIDELIVRLIDIHNSTALELQYCVFENRDVITRASKVINNSSDKIIIDKIMSTQLDFETHDYVFSTFNGSWAREMYKNDVEIKAGKITNSSYTGSSSNRANPFVMLSKRDTNEDKGICYGFNLVYSGNHYETVEVNGYGKMRFVSGINPESFEYTLSPGEEFEAPEAVMTFSENGFNGMSQRMHTFVRECVVRGSWKKKIRPVLLNSWEAAYFDINESKLLKLAKAGKDVGIELFVMDDGWFGQRNDDKSSLGDWKVNTKKLPNGVDGLCKKINELGLEFGIWVEPEMVNVNSELYRNHPEWVMQIPQKPHTEGRNQRILDLANPAVVDYMIEQMAELFSSANIAYVKWDMNRIFSDYYSQYLPNDRQGETAHRYILGLYRMMKTLTERFPNILFEGCSAGGNRFDLGILSFFPQIWASDDTDALYRVKGQTGYSYGYPMSTVTAHVSSCPNHQTLRTTPLETRFNVAAFGICGYECNLCDMKKEELEEIKTQIELYKRWRDVLQFGTFYRGRNDNIHEWTCVTEDKKSAVGMIMQEKVEPNMVFEQYCPKGLEKRKIYKFSNRNLRYNVKNFGDLVNTASPIHVKQDSLVHNLIAKFVKMPGETEEYTASGSVLMAGVKLHQAFGGTGYNDETRYFQDFASRIYFMEEDSPQEV